MKKLLMLAFLLLLVNSLNAQNFNLQWEEEDNITVTDDCGIDIVADASGNTYSAGVRGLRAVVRKYNASGSLLWTQTFSLGSGSGFGQITPVKIGVDGSGNVYLVAQGLQSDIMKRCIVKYNSAGTQLSATILGGTSQLYTTDAWIDANGVTYACGYIDTGAGSFNAEVAKYTNAGAQTWQQTYDAGFTLDDEKAEAIHVDGSNNVYITGNLRMGSDLGLLAIKYNSVGTQQWTYTYQHNYNFGLRKTKGTTIHVDASLNVYLAGFFEVSATEHFYLLTKLTSAGASSWINSNISGYFANAKCYPTDIYISGTELQVLGQKVSPSEIFTQQVNTSTGATSTAVGHNSTSGFLVAADRKFIRNVSGVKTKSFVANNQLNYWNGTSWESHLAIPDYYPVYSNAVIDNNNTITATGCKEVSATDRAHYVAAWCLKPVISGLPTSMTACTYQTVQIPAATIPVGSTVEWSPTTGLSDPNVLDPMVAPALTGTTYTLTVTSASGCENSQEITVARIPDPSKNIQVNGITVTSGNTVSNVYTLNACPGDEITLNGTNSNQCYLWYKDNLSNIIGSTCGFDPLIVSSSGTYFAEVTYSAWHPIPTYGLSSCGVVSFEVNVNMEPAVINLGADQAICTGSNATITAQSGFLSYLWNTGATTQSISPSAAGTYSVVGTYGSGCEASDEINVTLNPLPTIELGATIQACDGETVIVNAGSGYSAYAWSTGASSQSIDVTTNGYFFVNVTDANGCVNSDDINVVFNPLPTLGFTANSASVICEGETAYLEFFGADSYTMMPGNITTTNGFLTVSPTVSTNYTLTGISSSGCENTANFLVTVSSGPELSSNSNNATCGQSNGSATVIVDAGNGPFTYLWETGATSSTISNVASGTYDVTVTSNDGCSSEIAVFVNSTGGPSVLVSPTNVTCIGGSNGNATAMPSGGTSPYTYLWSNGQTSQTAVNLIAGSYNVVVTDDEGCQTNQNVDISFTHGLPTVLISGNTSVCEGNETQLFASGASSYIWNTGATGSSVMVGPTGTTNYSVIGTDANGCSNTSNVEVTVNSLPTIDFTVNSESTICEGESAYLQFFGGVSYVLMPGNNTTTGDFFNVSPSSTTNYTLTGTSTEGCENTANFMVTVNAAPELSSNSNSSACGQSNGSATVIVDAGNGPFTYLWETGAASSTISNVTAGSYDVTVTSNDGCSSEITVVVNATGGPTVLVSPTNVTCEGDANGSATAIPSGGTSPYTYLWSNGATTSSISGLPVGNYSVEVTDEDGCSSIENVSIDFQFTNPLVDLGTDAIICDNESITLDAGDGFQTYTWNTMQTTQEISVSEEGIYSVLVTDANGCEATDEVEITVEECLSLDEKNAKGFQLYPNPVQGSVIYMRSDVLMEEVKFMDAHGKIIRSTTLHSLEHQEDISDVSPGVYLIQVVSSSGTNLQKLVVE